MTSISFSPSSTTLATTDMSLLTKITAKDQPPPQIIPALPFESAMPTRTPLMPRASVYLVTERRLTHRGEPGVEFAAGEVKSFEADRLRALGGLVQQLADREHGGPFTILLA